jgi:dipeptidyl-peptidase-4
VIIYHYGGPGSQVVDNAWNVRSLWHKLMAQRGFAVFSVDNQSSTFFGKAGEDKDYRRFGTINLAGQLAGVDYLKTLPWVDASRLGLWGWSGGGSNTLYCVLNRPGVWKAAIAGAPVTDWRLYDSIWTERYLDRPQDNADGYRDSSPITYTANLKDHLLVVHGLADDNVHPQNSINLSGDLIKAGVPFEQAFYPGQKHGFRGPSLRHFYERATEFFERELKP